MKAVVYVIVATLCIGCIDTDVSIDEDNDTYTCVDSGEPCVAKLIVSPSPRDSCDDTGITNLLVGTCWWEQCVNGEKSLFPKISGVPCVLASKSGTSPWVEGTCDDNGACVLP